MIQERRTSALEVLVLPKPYHDRRALSPPPRFLRLIGRHNGKRENPAKIPNRAANGQLEIRFSLLKVLLDQMSDHLGVGFSHEDMILGLKQVFERQEVVDNPVVDDNYAP